MKAEEAIERRDRDTRLAEQLSRIGLVLVSATKQRLAERGQDDATRAACRLLVKINEAVTSLVETACLFDSFSKEVPESVLTNRLR